MPDPIKPTAADREAAEKFGNAWGANSALKFGLANILALHAQQAREQALEEAAKVADEYAFQSRSRVANNNPYDAVLLAGFIANNIRALKETPDAK